MKSNIKIDSYRRERALEVKPENGLYAHVDSNCWKRSIKFLQKQIASNKVSFKKILLMLIPEDGVFL